MRALKMLIVDDDRDNANSMGELLELEGHQAQVVYSGAQAIHRYLSEDYDMCFMDVMMPGMNGIESFIEIRKMKPRAKVFMMSGFSIEDLLKQAVVKGSATVLHQSPEVETLLGLINGLRMNDLVVIPHLGQTQIEFMRVQALSQGLGMRIAESPIAVERASIDDDLLVLNMNMPIIDVLGIYTSLRKVHDLPPTALIAPHSLHVRPEDALRDMHVTGILNKPFDLDNVLTHVKRLAA